VEVNIVVSRLKANQHIIRLGLLCALLFTQSIAYADYDSYQDEAIKIVKAIPTSEIEAGRPAQPFEVWMQNLAGKDAELKWELNDCGEGSGGPADRERDMPLCVSVNAQLPDGRWLDVSLGVANASDLKSGHPPDGVGMRGVAAGYKEAYLIYGDGFGPALYKLEDFLKVDIRSIRLYYASARGDAQTVRVILKKGVDIHSGYGQKAIFAAAENGQLPMVKMLLDAGADVNARISEETVLSAATRWHGQYYRDKMLALKPTPPACPDFIVAEGVVSTLKEKPASCGYEVGWDSYFEIVQLLIKKGTDTYSMNRALSNAASRQGQGSSQLKIVQLLIKAGADVNSKEAPLWSAANEKNVEVIRTLLEAGADIKARHGILRASAEGGSEEGMLLLIEHGAEVRPKDEDSPLFSAVQIGSLEKTRILLEHGADINAIGKSWYNNTPLMAAASLGQPSIVKLLIEKGADLNGRDKEGRTALTLALNNHHPQIAKLLRKAGAKE
jgi:ankyrin repeat protein